MFGVQLLLIVSAVTWVIGWLLALGGEMAGKRKVETTGIVLALLGTVALVVMAVVLLLRFYS